MNTQQDNADRRTDGFKLGRLPGFPSSILLALLAAGMMAGTAWGETWYWKGGASGTGQAVAWTNALNWTNSAGANPSGAPFASTDGAVIDGGANQPLLNLAASSVTIASLTVGSTTTSTLTFTNGYTAGYKLIVTGDVTITGLGTLTHPANSATPAHWLALTVGNNMSIQVSGSNTGKVNVAGKGYPATYGPSGVGGNGRCGGSHGGEGGFGYQSSTVISPYDAITNPVMHGAGSSGAGSGNAPVSGGGVAVLDVGGTLTLDGSITADGNAGGTSAGGGAGGTVSVRAGTLAGGGKITANGGTGNSGRGGGGGGGRVALVLTNAGANFAGITLANVQACGGLRGDTTSESGAAGTIYLKADGETFKETLRVDNSANTATYVTTSFTNATYRFDAIILTNRGILAVGTNAVLSLTNCTLFCDSTTNAITSRIVVNTDNGGKIGWPAAWTNRGTISFKGTNSWLSGACNLTVSTNGVLTCEDCKERTTYDTAAAVFGATNYHRIALDLTGNLTIDSGGAILATGKGCPTGVNPTGVAGNGTRPGGSHGGEGGVGTDATTKSATYGSVANPVLPGAGGQGSSGGGLILLKIDGTLTVNGSITADANGAGAAGAGAGGGVNIRANNVAGSGTVAVRGGSTSGNGSGGGGGRIAIVLSQGAYSQFTNVTCNADGGSGLGGVTAQHGAAGTIYLKGADQSYGTLIVNKSRAPLLTGPLSTTLISTNVTDAVVGDVLLGYGVSPNYAHIAIDSNATLTVMGSWSNAYPSQVYPVTGTGSVVFAGAATGTFYGGSTFANLVCTNAGKTLLFQGNTTNTVTSALTLAGASGNRIVLSPVVSSDRWYIKAQTGSTHAVSWVAVSNSWAVTNGGNFITATDSLDKGGNTNWNFINMTVQLTAPTNTQPFAYNVGSIAATAVVANAGSGLGVEFFTNGVSVGFGSAGVTSTVTLAGSFTPGTYEIYAVATDAAPRTVYSATNTFTVLQAPSVEVSWPTNGQTLANLSSVTATATVRNGQSPYTVVFYTNDVVAGTGAPGSGGTNFTYSLNALAQGTYRIYAVVTDAFNCTATSLTNEFTVSPPSSALGVSVTAPTNGQEFAYNVSSIAATAVVANAGSGLGVEFFTNGVSVGFGSGGATSTVTLAGSLAPGTYEIYAVATNDTPSTAHSSTNTFTVLQAPTVSVAWPTNGADFRAGPSITATATVAYGKSPYTVVFYTNDVYAGTDATGPDYTLTLVAPAAGAYTIYAVVTDAFQCVATSTTNSFTVTETPKIVYWTGAANRQWTNSGNWTNVLGEAAAPGPGTNVVIDSAAANQPLLDLAAGSVTIASLTVGSTAASTLTFTNGYAAGYRLVVTGDVTIGSSATLTHPANSATPAHWLALTVGNNMAIQVSGSNTGRIDVAGSGYPAYTGPGGAGGDGRRGGSHGGEGGFGLSSSSVITPYDSITNPVMHGAGGGDTAASANGSGGGVVVLEVAGALTNNGMIMANGKMPTAYSTGAGGGAGGTVNVRAGILTGSGTITANGGGGAATSGGGGGGGRIALVLTNAGATFAGFTLANVQACGGLPTSSQQPGGAGTVYLKADGETFKETLRVDNYTNSATYATTLFTNATYRFDAIILTNKGILAVGTNAVLSLTNCTLLCNSTTNAITSRIVVNTDSGGKLGWPAAWTNRGTISCKGTNSWLSGACNLTLSTNGILTHEANHRIALDLTGDLTIDSGGAILVTGRGCPAFVNPTGVAGDTTKRIGGSHGGEGGTSGSATGPSATYGSVTNPVLPGAGGGTENSGVTPGSGGGVILLKISGALTNDGAIAANGVGGGVSSGGGAGGSVNIRAKNIAGVGSVTVLGGDNNGGNSSGGGGGRIAIVLSEGGYSQLTGLACTADGGQGLGGGSGMSSQHGAGGTIYLKGADQSYGTLIVNKSRTPLTSNAGPLSTTLFSTNVTDAVVGDVVLTNYAHLAVGTTAVLRVLGNWNNVATTPGWTNISGQGTVELAGTAAATVKGSGAWYNLVITNAGKVVSFETNKTQFVHGTPDFGNNVTLQSAVAGSRWKLSQGVAGSTQDVGVVSVKDSDASIGMTFRAAPGSVNLGNNSNWVFQYTLDVVSAYGGISPAGPVIVNEGTTFTNSVANSPVADGSSTQYLCRGWTMAGNAPASGTGTNVVVTLTNNATLTWTWTTNYYLTLVTAGVSGGVDRASGFYEINSNVVVTATASNHYHLVGWSGDTNGCTGLGTASITVPMTGPRTITNTFAIDQHTLTVVSDHGGISPASPVTVDYGTTFTNSITNSPLTLSGNTTQYVCVAGTVVSNEFSQLHPTNVVAMLTNNATLTWTWTTNYYLTLVTAGASGGVDRASGFYEINSNVVVTATASNHYHLASWSGDTNGCTFGVNQITVPMSGSRSITPNFVIDQHTLTVQAGLGGGAAPGTVTVNYGTQFSEWISNALPVYGTTQYVSTGWTLSGNTDTGGVYSASETNVTLTLTNDATLTWLWSTNYYLALNTNGFGSVAPLSGFYALGSNVALTATAGAHWHFTEWSDDTNGCAISGTNLTTAALTGPRWITANFAIDTYTLRYTADANGWISGTATQTVAYGATGTVVTANGNPGWYLVQWSDGVTSAARQDGPMTNDVTVTATFDVPAGTVFKFR